MAAVLAGAFVVMWFVLPLTAPQGPRARRVAGSAGSDRPDAAETLDAVGGWHLTGSRQWSGRSLDRPGRSPMFLARRDG